MNAAAARSGGMCGPRLERRHVHKSPVACQAEPGATVLSLCFLFLAARIAGARPFIRHKNNPHIKRLLKFYNGMTVCFKIM